MKKLKKITAKTVEKCLFHSRSVCAPRNNNMFRLSLDNNLRSRCRRCLASLQIPAVKKKKKKNPPKHVLLPAEQSSTSSHGNSFMVGRRNRQLWFWAGRARSNVYGPTCEGSVFIWKKPLNLSSDSTTTTVCAWLLHIKDFFISTPSPLLPKYISPLNHRHGLIRF